MMRYRRRPASLSSEAREMNRSFPAFFAGGAESLRKLVILTITLRERFPRRECQENGPNPGEIGAANLGRLWGQNRCTIQPRRQQRGCPILLMS